jgi:hypothetical protein
MVCGSAGVSLAIFPISTLRKNAGETPAPLMPAFLGVLEELHFADRIRLEKCGLVVRNNRPKGPLL